jgi:small subunit ribosomal protein S6
MAEAQTKVRLREYDTVFLLKSDVTDDTVDKLKERVRGIINREGGKAIKFINWGKKKTAFVVAKQPRAVYVEAIYLGKQNLVTELERNLRNIDEVTKFLTTKVAEEIDPETRAVEPDEKRAGDVEEAPRPERSERRDDAGGEGDDMSAGAEE